jgi:hypothetical protein
MTSKHNGMGTLVMYVCNTRGSTKCQKMCDVILKRSFFNYSILIVTFFTFKFNLLRNFKVGKRISLNITSIPESTISIIYKIV